MIVYSLTGKSGTGKSYHAVNLCRKLGIDAMIDDGLFIYKNKIEAGRSAKREQTKVGAIRAAVFTREDHRAPVAARIREFAPAKILILGTSDEMTDKIAAQLGLPPVSERIHIEDITTEEERAIADKARHEQGKHVIPVPLAALKKDFSGYFVNPLRVIRARHATADSERSHEKTVVRPTYSYLGSFTVAEGVITDIARCAAQEEDGIREVLKVYDNARTEALILTVIVTVDRKPGIWESAMRYQQRLAEMVETMTAFNVLKVDVQVRRAV